MPSSAFVWDVSPELFSAGPLTIRWYGLLFASAFLMGYFIMRRMYRIEGKPELDLDKLLMFMVVGTIAGARLGHCLFYEPGYYLSNPLEILYVWKGGLASHGGALGIALALYLYSRKQVDQPFLWLLDRVAVPTALAGAFIRLGNFFNSEIIGVPTDSPLGVVFARVDSLPRHPAQLYESITYLAIFIVLFILYNRTKQKTPRGLLIGVFFVLVFSARFLIEFVKIDQVSFEAGLPLNMGQLLSIPVVITGAILWFRSRRQNGS